MRDKLNEIKKALIDIDSYAIRAVDTYTLEKTNKGLTLIEELLMPQDCREEFEKFINNKGGNVELVDKFNPSLYEIWQAAWTTSASTPNAECSGGYESLKSARKEAYDSLTLLREVTQSKTECSGNAHLVRLLKAISASQARGVDWASEIIAAINT